jgi:DNA-binding beta-propeller fold protein YncE
MRLRTLSVIGFLLLTAANNSLQAQTPAPLSLDARVALPDIHGRIDHLSVDLKGQRLFVAAVENHTLEVIDLASRKRIHTITGLPEPQGVYYDARSNRLFVACSLDGTVRIFDGMTFRPIQTIKFPDDADNLRYDPQSKEVIVGYAGAKELRGRESGRGGLGFLDLSGKRVADVAIDAHPESFQVDDTQERLYVNVPDKKEIEVIDLRQHKVISHWPVTTAQNNFPMALDRQHHRLIVACWGPPVLLAFDTDTGRLVASTAIAGKSDDLYFDAGRHRIYVLTARGLLDVLQQVDPDHYQRIAQYPTRPGTQTGFFVPAWGRLFAAARRQGTKDAQILVYTAH